MVSCANPRRISKVLTSAKWPYSYDSCDVGTLPNQTHPGTLTPLAAVENGDPANNDELVRAHTLLIPVHSPTDLFDSPIYPDNVYVCHVFSFRHSVDLTLLD